MINFKNLISKVSKVSKVSKSQSLMRTIKVNFANFVNLVMSKFGEILIQKNKRVTGYGLQIAGAKKDQVKATKRQSDMSFLKGLVGEGMRGLGESYVESAFREGVKSRIGITKSCVETENGAKKDQAMHIKKEQAMQGPSRDQAVRGWSEKDQVVRGGDRSSEGMVWLGKDLTNNQRISNLSLTKGMTESRVDTVSILSRQSDLVKLDTKTYKTPVAAERSGELMSAYTTRQTTSGLASVGMSMPSPQIEVSAATGNKPKKVESRKSKVERLSATWLRYAACLFMILCLGVGEVWGDQNLRGVYMTYDFNGSGNNYEYYKSDDKTNPVLDLGTLSSGNFKIKAVYWKCSSNWTPSCNAYGYYKINGGSDTKMAEYNNYSGSNGDYEIQNTAVNKVIASYTDASGSYSFNHWYYVNFRNTGDGWNTDVYVSNNSKNYTFNYKIAPPAVSGFTVTQTGALSGSGTSTDPYIVPYGGTLQLNLSGASQAHSDANSSAQYSVDNSSWGTATSNTRKTLSNITSTSLQNWVVYAKYYNSTASLSGETKSETIYYRALKVHEPGVYEKATGSGGYGKTLKTYNGTTTGNVDKKFELYYISASSSKGVLNAGESSPYALFTNAAAGSETLSSDQWVGICPRAYENSSSTGTDEMKNGGSSISTYTAKLATSSHHVQLLVSGYDQFTFFGRDQHASTSGKQFCVKIDGVTQSFTHQATDHKAYRFNLDGGRHLIQIFGTGSSSSDDNYFRAFSLRPAAPTISDYSMAGYTYTQGDVANTMTVTASPVVTGHALTYTWYSNTSASMSGATQVQTGSSSSYTPSTASVGGLYYICVVSEEGCNVAQTPWSGLITVNAAGYAVTYNNGGHGTAPSNTTATSVTLTDISTGDWINTGWKANVATTVGGEIVAANTLIANGSTVTLSAATTFTAQWSECSGPTQTNFATSGVTDGAHYIGDALGTLTVTASATNGGSLSYQWKQYDDATGKNNAVNAAGTNNTATYSIPNNAACTNRHYFCIVTESGCSHTLESSISGALTLTDPPTLYTVTYNVNGGGSVDPTSATQATEGGSLSLPTPTWSGYTFEGWYNAGTKIGNAGASYTPTADITLYAHWTDNISGKVFSYIDNSYGDKFKDFKDGSWVTGGGSGKDKTYTNGTTGVEFRTISGAWDKKNNAISALAKLVNGTTSMSVVIPTGKIATVKISYGAYNTSNRLTVGGSNQTALSTALTDGMTNAQVYSALKEITLESQTGTLALGSSTGNIYIGRVSAVITGYTVTYDKGTYGTGTLAADTKTAGSALTLSSSSSAFTRDGYTYDGWSTNADGSTKDYNLGGSYTTDAAITLYPHWVANATISATLESDEYMRIGAAGMELSVSITGASSGWYYRVKNSDTEGYQTPDMTTYTTTSWTMTSAIGAATNHYVVELYNGSNVKMATSNTITVYGETGHPVTIVAGANGSVSPSGEIYANGQHLNPTITATPSSGYRFVNWTLSNGNATLADATSASTTITSASGACTVTANFTLDVYTLTWDLAGGTVTTAGTGAAVNATGTPSTSVAPGASITTPVVARDGYDFLGWDVTPAGTMPSANTTYTAQWARAYTVTYNYNGATSGATPASATSHSVTLPTPTRTSYEFDGWYTTAGTKIGAGGDTYNPTADITLYARWEESCAAGGYSNVYSMTLSGTNGKTDVTITQSTADVASITTVLDDSEPIDKSGDKYFKFGSSSAISITYTFAVGDKLVFDVCSKDDNKSCGVSVKVGSADAVDVTGTLMQTPSTLNYTITSAGSATVVIKRAGDNASSMRLHGIAIQRSGGGGGTCYHVYYHGNGAESGFVSDTTSYANSATVTILDYDDSRYPLTKAGYTFQGWATSAEGSVAKTAGQTATISSADIHYYAVWAEAAPTYTITNGNPSHGTIAITDGSSAITSAEEDATVHISATPADGYSFTSWSVTKDAGGSVDVATSSSTNPTTFTMPAEDVTVNATFSPNTYTITYNLNGASWAGGYSAPANYTVGTGATLPIASNMSNTGYTFEGWYANSDLSTGGVVTSISTSDYGDKEFWAKWTENTYDVTYNANGGSGSMTGQNGHYVTLKDNEFTYADHIFVKWNTATDGSGTSYSEGEEVELTADLNLYAIWASDYTITWDASAKLGGVDATPNLGGGNYTITASVADWTGTLIADMVSTPTSGVTITNVAVDNSSSPKTATVTFAVTEDVTGDAITLTIDVPTNGSYGAKSSDKVISISRCEGGSTLFSQDFDEATEVEYTNGTATAYTVASADNNIVGNTAASQFTYMGIVAKSSAGIAINTNSGGNSKKVPGVFQAYCNATGGNYAIVKTTNFDASAPTALKISASVYFQQLSSGSDYSLTFAVGDGFSNGTSAPSSSNVHSGFSIINNSNAYLSQFASKTVISGSNKLTQGSFQNVVWVINNTGSDLTYDDPNGGTSTVENDKFDVWVGKTKFVAGQAATTASKTLQNLYIGDPGGKKHEFRLDNIRVVSLSGAGGKVSPTLTWSAPATVNKETGNADFTYAASTTSNTLGAITYTSSNTSVANVNASGKVHIVGTGSTTITATLAATGCYNGDELSYTLNVTSGCDDVAGTIVNNDGSAIEGDAIEMSACATRTIKVTGHTTSGETVSYQWYKDGVSLGSSNGAQTAAYTIQASGAGEYYVTVTNTGDRHCAMVSTNTITVTNTSSLSIEKVVHHWYVKAGRRTPDIALAKATDAVDFVVEAGGAAIWSTVSGSVVTTGLGGCGFYMDKNGVIYLKGTKDNGDATDDITADKSLKILVHDACNSGVYVDGILIHRQAATTYKEIAFVVDGTRGGAWNAVESGHADGTPLYEYLDSVGTAASARKFKLSERNIYKTTVDSTLRSHYSQFDAIIITDDPNTMMISTGKDSSKKKYQTEGYVNAFGTLIDVRPILTMEAYVSALKNWGAKGVAGDPSSPNPRQYEMRLQCKDHEIYSGLPDPAPGTHVWSEMIDGEEFRHVIMVDSTKSPYNGVDWNEETKEKPALQGFSSEAMGDLLGLGVISGGSLHAGIERQKEPAARMMLLGLNNKALPNALTAEGKRVIANALTYLCKTNMEDVDDCSNFFVGTIDSEWNKSGNWSKGSVPTYETKVRILVPCVVSNVTAHAATIDIATGGTSKNKAGTCTGSLTINADGALIVGGEVRSATAPYFNRADLKPTTVNDLVINTSASNQAALILNNDKGDTKATVNLYSLGRKPSSYQYQYFAIPMEYLPVNPTFANETHGGTKIYTYVWEEGTSSWTRRKYYDDLFAFEGLGITTNSTADYMDYTMTGNLVSTAEREITLTYDGVGNNIIGNSYTAPINISSLVTAFASDESVVKTVYIYSTGRDPDKGTGSSNTTETAGQWLAIPMEAAAYEAWGGLKVIPSMQAFLIQVTGETGMTLDYDEMVRTNKTNYNEKLHAPQRFADEQATTLTRLRVADSQTHTDLYLFEGEKFSEGFDNGWEATYMEGDGRSAQLYAMAAEEKMAVLATPELEGTQVGFVPGQETAYTFSFTGGTGEYYLNDIKAQKSALIQEGNTYSFEYANGDDANRFYISRTAIDAPATPTGVNNTDASPKAQKFIYQNKLYILRNGVLYDATGKVVR